MEEFSHIPDHGTFIQLLVNAKAFADLNGVAVPVSWRGYSSLVEANLPPFNRKDYEDRLTEAMRYYERDNDSVKLTKI